MKVDIFSECFHNVEPFRPEVYVAPGLVSSKVPYLVGLVETENPKTIICAGSLLNYRWVLTLASCTQEKKHNNKKYKVGGILKAKTKYLFWLQQGAQGVTMSVPDHRLLRTRSPPSKQTCPRSPPSDVSNLLRALNLNLSISDSLSV